MFLGSIHFLCLQPISTVCTELRTHSPTVEKIVNGSTFRLVTTEGDWNREAQNMKTSVAATTGTGTSKTERMLYA